jgi:putative cardiolipin synthase
VLSLESRAGLHAKTMLVDGRRAVIGSYNLDPRSAEINTEMVLLVESPVFGAQLREFLDEGVEPANAWRVRLEEGDLVWIARDEEEGEARVYHEEPETGWWQRFVTSLIGILPVQSQL